MSGVRIEYNHIIPADKTRYISQIVDSVKSQTKTSNLLCLFRLGSTAQLYNSLKISVREDSIVVYPQSWALTFLHSCVTKERIA